MRTGPALSPTCGRRPDLPRESLGKMALVGKAAFKRDLRQCLISRDQQAGSLNSLHDQPGVRRDPDCLGKGLDEVAGGKPTGTCHLGNAHLL